MKDDDMKVKLSLRIFNNENKAFGPGIARLLQLIESEGSLHKASKTMNIAYSKAWKILKESEKALGFELVEGKRGGVDGGGSKLSKKGSEILDKYIKFSQRAEEEVEKIFTEFF